MRKAPTPSTVNGAFQDHHQRDDFTPNAQKIGNHATADELAKALEILRRPLRDRQREFYPHVGGALLIDDGGGTPVECFDDITAVHFFLRWLDDSREQRAARFEVARRRASIALVKRGDHDI